MSRKSYYYFLKGVYLSLAFLCIGHHAHADFRELRDTRNRHLAQLLEQKVSPNLRKKLVAVEQLDVIIEYQVVRPEAKSVINPETLLKQRQKSLSRQKQSMLRTMDRINIKRNFNRLPLQALTIRSVESLETLLMSDQIKAIYFDEPLELHLNESLELIQQPQLINGLSVNGENTTVVILDSGVRYNRPEFGSCSAPGEPESCRVVAAFDLAAQDNVLDDTGHGTNVSAIVAGVAPQTNLAVLDILGGGSIATSDIIEGINWALDNRAQLNVVAINLSLGSTTSFSSPCIFGNPFRTPVLQAREQGIVVIASSGNSGESNGIASPGCTPEVISVGAVYDVSGGGVTWTNCQDSSRRADQITCFSNSDDFLDLLAPGAVITAGGLQAGGTSQASPHVAGAAALLRSAYPSESASQIEARLKQSAVSILDTRNNVNTPRLDLLYAIGALNDSFAEPLSFNDTVRVSNVDASSEVNEPSHAGRAGGRSLWWRWTALSENPVCFDTRNSDLDTVLAVYIGSDLSNLIEINSNDNDSNTLTSKVCFTPSVGQEYRIAVDSVGGAVGTIVLNATVMILSIEDDEIPMLPLWALMVSSLFLFMKLRRK